MKLFHNYFSDRWANVQAIDVIFSQDLTHQKSLKSANFWESNLKNKKVDVFWNTDYTMYIQLTEKVCSLIYLYLAYGYIRHRSFWTRFVIPLRKVSNLHMALNDLYVLMCRYGLYTPPTRTRQNCLVRSESAGVNKPLWTYSLTLLRKSQWRRSRSQARMALNAAASDSKSAALAISWDKV